MGTRRVGGFLGLTVSFAVTGVSVPLRKLLGLYPSETDVHGLCGLGSFGVTVTTPLPTPSAGPCLCHRASGGPALTTVGGLPRPVRAALFLLKCLWNCRGITAFASCHLQWPQSSWAAGLGG